MVGNRNRNRSFSRESDSSENDQNDADSVMSIATSDGHEAEFTSEHSESDDDDKDTNHSARSNSPVAEKTQHTNAVKRFIMAPDHRLEKKEMGVAAPLENGVTTKRKLELQPINPKKSRCLKSIENSQGNDSLGGSSIDERQSAFNPEVEGKFDQNNAEESNSESSVEEENPSVRQNNVQRNNGAANTSPEKNRSRKMYQVVLMLSFWKILCRICDYPFSVQKKRKLEREKEKESTQKNQMVPPSVSRL